MGFNYAFILHFLNSKAEQPFHVFGLLGRIFLKCMFKSLLMFLLGCLFPTGLWNLCIKLFILLVHVTGILLLMVTFEEL